MNSIHRCVDDCGSRCLAICNSLSGLDNAVDKWFIDCIVVLDNVIV